MSAFRDALESQLVCPKCEAENIPGRSPTLQIEDGAVELVGCNQCGHTGRLVNFLRPSQQEKRT